MNNNDLISRQTAIDKLFEYAESKFQSGEIELANGILNSIQCSRRSTNGFV